jgi:hypothetical protein
MEWWQPPIPSFPSNFVFKGDSINKKANKLATRQKLYINDSFFNETLPSKHKKKQHRVTKPKPKPKPKKTSPQQELPPAIKQPITAIVQLSSSEKPWPLLQKTVTIYPPLPIKFDEVYVGPLKPAWFHFLLPCFQDLAPIAAPYVPHSSYMNIRLHALNELWNKRLFTEKGPNIYGPWLVGQTLRILLPMLRVRRLMRRFVQLYRCYQCNKRAERMDPFTLCESEKPIKVYCFKTKKRYDYDPISIVRHICTSLRYQNSAFADPRFPKIPQTNELLSCWQLTSIHEQARQKGISSQVLNNFRSVQWNLLTFSHLFSHDLQRHAIRNEHFTSDSFIARENITYWIEMSASTENIYLEDDDFKLIQFGIDNHPNHTYLSAWRGVIMNYLSECNTFPNSQERKAHAKNIFHKKCVQLLKLFCDFCNQMVDLREKKENELFASSEAESESQDE